MTDTTTDSSTAELSPQMKPLALPARALAYRGDLWRPVLVDEEGLCVVGGPNGLSILQIFSRQQVWFSITPQVWLTGFTVHESTLYVQDGPVLCQWDLADGALRAAVNLVTQKTWNTSQPTLTDTTRAALYALSTDLTARQQALQKARNQAAWADLMEEADAAEASLTTQVQQGGANFDTALDQLINVRSMSRALRTMAGATDATHADPSLIQKLRDALTAAQSEAAAVIFCAPKVRAHQLYAQAGGSVFSLARDGTLHALDNALTHVGSAKFTAPVTTDLAMYEDSSVTSGEVPCFLAYLTAEGRLQVVNGAVSPPQVASFWEGGGSIETADGLLPLASAAGYFWGGGVPGRGFFGIPVNAVSSGPTATLDGSWTDYEISVKEALALVSDGLNTHLWAYTPGMKLPERWGTLSASAAGWTSFWTDDGLDTPTAARLVLQVEKDGTTQSPAGLNLRTYAANTVDDPSGHKPFISPTMFASRVMRPGSFTGVTFARLRAPIGILRDTAYAAIGSATPYQQIVALTTASSGSSGWSQFQDANRATYATGASGAWDLGACPLPTMPSTDQLAAFSLATLKAEVMPKAVAELEVIASAAAGYPMSVTILGCNSGQPISWMPLRVYYNDRRAYWLLTTDGTGTFTVKLLDYMAMPASVAATFSMDIEIRAVKDGTEYFHENARVSLKGPNVITCSYYG